MLTLLPAINPVAALAQAPSGVPADLPSSLQTGSAPARRHVGRGVPVTWAMSPRMAERRAKMREVGARMFARLGITGAAILDIAREAHVPVSAAAHGYRRRQDLVFDILYAYVDALHEYVGAADEAHEGAEPEVRLVAVVTGLLDGIHAYRDSHQLMLTAFPTMPDEHREALRYVIRTLTYRLAAPLEAVVPALTTHRHMQAPLIQSVLGMASHAPSWLKETGPMTRSAYAGLIARAVTEAGKAALRAA